MRRAWLCWARRLLLGLHTRAAFSSGFRRLPVSFQTLDCGALLLILATVGLLLATPSFHQIAERGHATSRFVARASGALQATLPLLALALGIDVAIGLVGMPAHGAPASRAARSCCSRSWSGMWFRCAAATRRERKDDPMEDSRQSLEARIVQALTELRVDPAGRAGAVRLSAERRADRSLRATERHLESRAHGKPWRGRDCHRPVDRASGISSHRRRRQRRGRCAPLHRRDDVAGGRPDRAGSRRRKLCRSQHDLGQHSFWRSR